MYNCKMPSWYIWQVNRIWIIQTPTRGHNLQRSNTVAPRIACLQSSFGARSFAWRVKKLLQKRKWRTRAKGLNGRNLSPTPLPARLLPPVDGIIVHRRVSPKQYVTGTHLYTWMKRDKVSKVPLFKETTRRSRLEPRTSRSGVRGVNHSATHASKERLRRRVNRLGRFYWIHFNIEVFGN